MSYVKCFSAVFFQVIIQGLRESGVLSSVVSSAQGTLLKDQFLASVESSNSSRGAASESLSRKMGRNSESHTTMRKALEARDTAVHEAAVPPLSPPGMNFKS